MARYKTFTYGDGTLYGAEAAPGPVDVHLLWTVLVDWDGDGYFSGENEAENMIGFSLARGRDHFVDPSGDGFERYADGRATLMLDNTSGRYNPFNTAGPLYPYVTPGKVVRIKVLDRDTNTDHELMRGRIADIQPYNDGMRKMVRIEVVDGQLFLRGRTVKIGERTGYPEPETVGHPLDWTTGQWVDFILERAGWPEGEWPRTYNAIEDANGNQLGVATTENFYRWLHYAWFWLRDAYEAIGELENAELGTFLHARDGSARFLSSHFSYDKVVGLDESEILTDITTPQPWETLRNKIEARVHYIYQAGITPVILWKIGGTGNDALLVAAEGSRTFEADFKYFNYNIVPHYTRTINKTFNAAKDGTGTNLTSQTRVQLSEIGDGATVIFLNDSVTDGYIINLDITADPLYSPYSTVVSAEDAASQAIYGLRAFRLESPWLQEFDWADTLKAMLLNVLKDPTQYPTIKIQHRPDKQFALDLYVDAIHLTAATLGINALYRIGKIEHQWLDPTGNAVLTTLKLEPYFALDAQAEVDFDLLSPLTPNTSGGATSPEIGCTGSPSAGKMKFCLEEPTPDFEGWVFSTGENDHTFGDFIAGGMNGLIRGRFNGGNEADAASQNLSYALPEGCALAFWYQWQDTNSESAGDQPCSIILSTTESGTIVNQFMPFELISGTGDWTQVVIDLSDYAGQTLTSLIFRKPSSYNSVGNPLLRLDDIGLGKLIYDGSN